MLISAFSLMVASITKIVTDGQLQLVIPKVFRRKLIEEIHGGALGGHFGVERTTDAVRIDSIGGMD